MERIGKDAREVDSPIAPRGELVKLKGERESTRGAVGRPRDLARVGNGQRVCLSRVAGVPGWSLGD